MLEWATAAYIYPQLVMPSQGRSSLLAEQIQTGASRTCTPWIWVRPAAVEHVPLDQSAGLRAAGQDQRVPRTLSSDETASFSSKNITIIERSLRSQQTPRTHPPPNECILV